MRWLPNPGSKFRKSRIIVSHRPRGPLAEKIRQVASRRVTHQAPAAMRPLGSTLQRVFCMRLAIAIYIYKYMSVCPAGHCG